MKRINWERFEKLEYSARRAGLEYPGSKLGKEMLFLVDTVQLLRLQVKSLQERLKPVKTDPVKKPVIECYGYSEAEVNQRE